MNIWDAIGAVVKHAPSTYAKAYAKAAVGMSGEALRVQCLYILNNTQSWRGEQARQAKAVLREFSK